MVRRLVRVAGAFLATFFLAFLAAAMPALVYGYFFPFTIGMSYLLFLPLAVVDHLTRLGPVFLPASFLVIFLATFLGRQAG